MYIFGILEWGEWREGGNLNLAALRQQLRIEDRQDIAARGKEGPHLHQQNIHLTAEGDGHLRFR